MEGDKYSYIIAGLVRKVNEKEGWVASLYQTKRIENLNRHRY
jgi:hypothetical protein